MELNRQFLATDEDNEPFWQGLLQHKIVLQRCLNCKRIRLPFMPSCPYCACSESEEVVVPGTGTVYSWVGVNRALTEAMASEVPYAIAAIDLDDGARFFGRVVPPERATIGLRVEAFFVDHEGWTELRFQPIETKAQS